MKSKAVWALVVLNVLLLAALVGQWLRPNTAIAQMPRPSDYILIPGHVQGSPAEVIYMIDTQNGLLSARTFNGQGFSDMTPIRLDRYFQGGARGGQPRGRNY
ncbi:MAG TPA: hypothetical protein VN541_23845 [Tepidisphaeraceae bacterium]|nr:hypothetical protein [Tepidisphaeraceae bacterium]